MNGLIMRKWLLPDYIEDVLPQEAAHLESLRRTCLDLLKSYGYQYVVPPMIEYVDSLITGVGHDLDLATFKVIDHQSARMMGIRADMTPQVARIDAHLLNLSGVTRLCYAGSVLKTMPDGLAHTREPIQLGAELFGYAGVEGDIEIQQLMVKLLQAVGVKNLLVDFSHVGIFESLISPYSLSRSQLDEIYPAMQSKDLSSLTELPPNLKADLDQLNLLHGDISILREAKKRLPQTPIIDQALADLEKAGEALIKLGVSVSYDLAELRGYQYHNGMVFTAYARGFTGPCALGGRYDDVGEVFGRQRPATGFSLDLRGLINTLPTPKLPKAILAPFSQDAALQTKINQLRADGECVVALLPGTEVYQTELDCDRKIIQQQGQWVVVKL
jgi:ATP phosphoribosyltransferase regulatory subunit